MTLPAREPRDISGLTETVADIAVLAAAAIPELSFGSSLLLARVDLGPGRDHPLAAAGRVGVGGATIGPLSGFTLDLLALHAMKKPINSSRLVFSGSSLF